MAVGWWVHHNQCFLVAILTILFCFNGSYGVEERTGTCGTKIDLSVQTTNIIYSGILKVPMPKSFDRYQGASTRQEYCDIQILFGSGVYLQIELYYLDIVPISSDMKSCSTGLEVTDSANTQIYAGRLCMEGWRWEKQHREKKQEKKIVKSSPLRLRLISEGPYKGTGFKLHFNVFRPVWPCSNVREFKCERYERCVNEELTCDGWDDCGDDTDEDEEAGCDLLTVSEIFAVIIGVFLFIGTVAASVVFMIKYRRIIKRNRMMRMESKLTLNEERRSMQEPVLSFPHRFNSMESGMNKSQYSRTTGQKLDIDSLIDRMELDKADKYSHRDNMSERSHRSHRNKSYENGSDRNGPSSRRNRASSQSSLTREKAGVVGSQPDLDKEGSEKDKRDDDRGSERRRSKERRRYSDEDDDYDSDRERRRRRRSRDRRRYDRSDDEDYDSDRDRRRRSKDKYDSEEENDSDRERRRRRRSRDRRRYDSDEDYDSDSGRRRRRRRRSKDGNEGNSDEENDSDRESRRKRSRDRRRYSDDEYDSDRDRRRRSRDRRRYDSDEYDSDRDRRRRRSRDRRSRDLSETKDEKDQSQPGHDSEGLSVKPPQPSKEMSRERDNDRRGPYHEKEKPKKEEEPPAQKQAVPDLRSGPPKYEELSPEKSKAPYSQREQSNNHRQPSTTPKSEEPSLPKQRGREPDNYPRPSTPPKSEQLQQRYNRAPQSNNAPKESNGTAWVPRSERKRNRRSRGDPNSGIYEDVVPKVQLENMGFHEESV